MKSKNSKIIFIGCLQMLSVSMYYISNVIDGGRMEGWCGGHSPPRVRLGLIVVRNANF